jgi:hypothetical protein
MERAARARSVQTEENATQHRGVRERAHASRIGDCLIGGQFSARRRVARIAGAECKRVSDLREARGY